MDFGRIANEARKRAASVAEVLKEAAFDLSWDLRDAAKTGFGVPALVSNLASLGVATVAAAGAASVAFDLGGKVWGKKECRTCNGWEGLRCTACAGSGRVQYHINESSLTEAERSSAQSIAAAAIEGRAQIEYVPGTVKLDFPLPFADCPKCEGTGVTKCGTCNGDAWVPRFTIARSMDAPWLAWNAYRKIGPPNEDLNPAVITDPLSAEFLIFGKDELEHGIQYDEKLKQEMVATYQDVKEYEIVRDKVARREPGWETWQKVLFLKDPQRAEKDPVIVRNPPYYKAKMKIWKEVSELPVPPRPVDWLGNVEQPLNESNWTKEDLEDPRKKSEMKVLLEGQEKFLNTLRDNSWEQHWRTQKFEEIKREMIESYEREKEYQRPVEPEAKQDVVGVSPTIASTKQAKPPVEVQKKKAEVKKRPDDDKKRRERQERSERMARQAVEREAALAKAKAARESKGQQ